MKIDYAFAPEDEGFAARAMGRELRVKFKDCKEVCAAIRGMKAEEAKTLLEKVLDEKAYIPGKKMTRQGGHKPGMKPFGYRPVKTVKAVLAVLKSAIANAEFRGLDVKNCIVKSALALRGRKTRRMKPKGKHTVFQINLTTVQIVLEEVSE